MRGLNESKGNMYPFCTHTWNTIKGMCPHNHEKCYCYMNIYELGLLRFDSSELDINLGSGNFIFFGSSCDAFAKGVPDRWIERSLAHMNKFPDNTYLLQSKNAPRFLDFRELFPENVVLGTTIESNRVYPQMCHAPSVRERALALVELSDYRRMVTIEPILAFDMAEMMELISIINPEWVNVGADSKGHHMVEPRPYNIKLLIEGMREFTVVKLKSNLERVVGRSMYTTLNK